MHRKPNELLLIAHSARFLAQSASRYLTPLSVLDGFNDDDTLACAQRYQRIDFTELKRAACQLPSSILDWLSIGTLAGSGIVYGAGLEAMPEVIASVAHGRTLFGNTPETLQQICQPKRFFALLDALEIAHPVTRFDKPQDPSGWLVKLSGGAGGAHVARLNELSFSADPLDAVDYYYQRFIPGTVLSCVFLADGDSARIIGFNSQFLVNTLDVPEFTYGGAINRALLTLEQRRHISEIINLLTKVAGLVGLNGIDFIIDNGSPSVLEINPRPTATCELYDQDFDQGILEAHLAACEGQLPDKGKAFGATIRSHAIVYSTYSARIPNDTAWPVWTTDRPSANSTVPATAPVCSVHAEGKDENKVKELIIQRMNSVQSLLNIHRNAA